MEDEFTIFLFEVERLIKPKEMKVQKTADAAEILVVLAVVAVVIMFGVWLMRG